MNHKKIIKRGLIIVIMVLSQVTLFSQNNSLLDTWSSAESVSEDSNLKKSLVDSYNLNGKATFGFFTWGKSGDAISFNFETDPSIEVEVYFMDREQWDNLPRDDLMPGEDGIFFGKRASALGFFFPQYEDQWFVVFRNPTYTFTKLIYEIDTSPHIIIVNPSSSTTSFKKSTLEIRWKSNIITSVRIDLYKKDSLISTLNRFTLNDGQAACMISEDWGTGDDYRIKISDERSDEYDFSEFFSIRTPSIEIFFPYNGDVYIPHTSRTICWSSSGTSSKVSISLLLDNQFLLKIINETDNDGTHDWIVWQGEKYSNHEHSTYQIVVSDCKTENYLGTSHIFTITGERSMEIIRPLIKSSFKNGEEIVIDWWTNSTCLNVNILLMKGTTMQLDLGEIRNSGSFTWKIPPSIPEGDNYCFFINTMNNSTSAMSSHFTITPNPASIPAFDSMLFTLFFLLGIFAFYKKILKIN